MKGAHEARRSQGIAALAALALFVATAVYAVVVAVEAFPSGLGVLACLVLAVAAALWAFVRRGIVRVAGFALAAALLAGAVALAVTEGYTLEHAIVAAGIVLALLATQQAFAPHVDLPAAPRPRKAVLFYNPKSGGGKATRFKVADEARARGVEPVELERGDDLEQLARDAVAGGADALGVAGGDGSQAIVAAVAAETGLPYVCIPAGTRNHFALDLGVDRNDVVGALDAFSDGAERTVDLAEVNGRVFVNNVSLGVYGEAVEQPGYRDAKLRTLADTVPTILGPHGHALDLRWTGPAGEQHETATMILVSNDPYRLGHAIASGTRPSLARGTLGIAAADTQLDRQRLPKPQLLAWSAPTFEIDSGVPVAAGIDGETVRLDPPLRFRARPRALRVRVARRHPGASPSAMLPDRLRDYPGALVRTAFAAR